MQIVELEIKSHLKVELEIKSYPKLTSEKEFIQKAINVVKKYSPKIYSYVSKEDVISNLKKYEIKIISSSGIDKKEVKKVLSLWLGKEKVKRFVYSLLELLVFPFTALLTPIPGPNVAFFSVVILFYFHFRGFLNLKGVKIDDLKVIYE